MRKLLTFVCLLTCMMPTMAQTDFRSLSYEEALKAAQKENKLVFIDFYTSWCGPCKLMAKEVFPQQKVGDFINPRLVAIKLDAEKEGKEAAQKYGVKAYPTYVVAKPDGTLMNTFVGYMKADEFINKLAKSLNPDLTPAKMKSAYASGKRSPQLIDGYTDYIWSTAGRNNAAQKADTVSMVINEYYSSLSDKDRMSAENLFVYEKAASMMRDVDAEPVLFVADHWKEFPQETRQAVRDCAKNTVMFTAMQYMMNRMGEGKMKVARQTIDKLNLCDDPQQGGFFRFMREFDASTPERLYATSPKIFDYVTDTLTLQSFWFNFPTHFNGKDEATRQQAADFLRTVIDRIPTVKGFDFNEIVETLRKPWVDPEAVKAQVDANEKKMQEGADALMFELKDMKGKTYTMKDFKGKYVVLDFWASWCGPCLKAMPHVKEMNDKYKATGKLAVIGVNCDDNEDAGRQVVEKNGYDWLQLLSKNGDFDLANAYGIKYLPTLIVISPDGKIVKRLVNDKEALFEYIDSVMK